MASQQAIVSRRGVAREDLAAAIARLSGLLGVPPPAAPASRDPQMAAILETETQAAWIGQIADAVEAGQAPESAPRAVKAARK